MSYSTDLCNQCTESIRCPSRQVCASQLWTVLLGRVFGSVIEDCSGMLAPARIYAAHLTSFVRYTLLYSLPGTGETLLKRSVATSSFPPSLFLVESPEPLNMYTKRTDAETGAQRPRAVFLEELDSIRMGHWQGRLACGTKCHRLCLTLGWPSQLLYISCIAIGKQYATIYDTI